MENKEKRATITELFLELKTYYERQKEHKTYLIAEQLTRVISSLAIVMVVFVLALVIFVFLGMAVVQWLRNIIDSVAVCYLIYALFLLLILIVFYLNRRRWIILPLARLMISVFIKAEEESDETNKQSEKKEDDDDDEE